MSKSKQQAQQNLIFIELSSVPFLLNDTWNCTVQYIGGLLTLQLTQVLDMLTADGLVVVVVVVAAVVVLVVLWWCCWCC
jgi:hypothetical protein